MYSREGRMESFEEGRDELGESEQPGDVLRQEQIRDWS